MSDYDKAQNFVAYDYNTATRSGDGADYGGYAAHHSYPVSYAGTQSQVPSGLPQSAAALTPVSTTQHYAPNNASYYPQQQIQYPRYVGAAASPAPRPLPDSIQFTPAQGRAGTAVTVYFRSPYDFDDPPVSPIIMFGQTRCQSVLSKMGYPGQPFQYSVTAEAPPMTSVNTLSPHTSLSLVFEDTSIAWEATAIELGNFTYLDQPPIYSLNPAPQVISSKRKLSPEASPRRSPTKKPSLHQLSGPPDAFAGTAQRSPSRSHRASPYPQSRRASGSDMQSSQHHRSLRNVKSQYFYGSNSAVPPVPALPPAQSPSWGNPLLGQNNMRSPSGMMSSMTNKAPLLPSPASAAPALIRTSTMHGPVTAPSVPNASSTVSFNPYTMYPANTKAVLKIEGDLNTMTQRWTADERETGRRLVQFRRSQQGSIITANFEPVSLEDRIPNSICVSCIWWEERDECYVTSVDTISLLESLVAVRFTVEEKNRIRRNLEGFRPMTVSKAKADSDDFFKLIMGFPNPKPRNIEKDVKVFPWRILYTALKKIISKYSASYSSTAGILHTPGNVGANYHASRTTESSIEPQQRAGASPHSTSSSSASYPYSHSMSNPYSTVPVTASSGLGLATGLAPSSGNQGLRLDTPVSGSSQAQSWQAPMVQYTQDPAMASRLAYDHSSNAAYGGLSHSGSSSMVPNFARPFYGQETLPPLSAPMPTSNVARFVPMQHYEDQANQQTSTA